MNYRLLLTVAAVVAGADALTKALAVALSRWMPIRLPGGWALQVAHNPGVILGFGAGTIAPDVFALIGTAEIAFLLIVNRHQCGPLWATGFGLMIGGAIGNLGEHQIFGFVVDWVMPPQPDIVFNLADVAVVCGQVLLSALQLLGLRTRRTPVAVTK
jgi:signal peptidase II